jgi:hypothetical protein
MVIYQSEAASKESHKRLFCKTVIVFAREITSYFQQVT